MRRVRRERVRAFILSPALHLPLRRPIIFIDCIYKLEIRLINAQYVIALN